jgi:hypothetical protein
MCDSDQLAFVWWAGRVLKSVLFLGTVLKIRGWVRSGRHLRICYWLRERRSWCARIGPLLPTYACEVGTEALHGNDDAAFLFEPLPDACQALPIGNGSPDLGPKGAKLAGFCRRLFPAPLCEAEPGFGDPLLLGLCVFFVLWHVFNNLRRFRHISAKFDNP